VVSAEQAASVEQIFEAALECVPSLRTAYVAMACGDNEVLRREVEDLLAHTQTPEQFHQEPVLNLPAQEPRDSQASTLTSDGPVGAL